MFIRGRGGLVLEGGDYNFLQESLAQRPQSVSLHLAFLHPRPSHGFRG